jgi:RNA polymerase primary sigma factor
MVWWSKVDIRFPARQTPLLSLASPDMDTLSDSNLDIYLRQIGAYPLLTRQEEKQLGRRIRRGDKKARQRMILSNLRLVVKIANDYANLGLPLPDLISEGNIGLMKAVGRFNPHNGAKLSTYAAWWIKQCIRRALANQSRTIRIPVHGVDLLRKVRKARFRWYETMGCEPSNEELSAMVRKPASVISTLCVASKPLLHLDQPCGSEEDGSLGERVADENAPPASDLLERKMAWQDLSFFMSHLEPRAAEIIARRYGLNGYVPETLEVIGRRFRITRERIRQIQDGTLHKLRKLMEDRDKTSPLPGKGTCLRTVRGINGRHWTHSKRSPARV